MTIEEETSFPRLRRFSLDMGFLHLVQGVLMIVLGNDSTRPIYTSFLTFDLENFALVPVLCGTVISSRPDGECPEPRASEEQM